MSTKIEPSDSYIKFLVPPQHKTAPEHIKKLLSKYRITHFLGAGGFADVYEGTDENGWGVAIKVPQFKMEKTMDSTSLKRFASEADIWKKLQHDNIVTVYETGAKPIPHIVMELMDGGDLESLMRGHRLTVEEAVHIMVQILEGISYAHRMATVHRDLKPENILFTSAGEAKITDWGIGKYMASEGLTKTLDTKGTLAYSAPEQFDTKEYGEVDWQTDIFQLGIVFYEMLTGEKPFQGRDMAEVMGKVLTYYPVPPSDYNSDVPLELDDIVMGALEKYKEDRWESGAVMLHELRLLVEGKVRIKSKERKHKKALREARKQVRVLDDVYDHLSMLEDAGADVSRYNEKVQAIEKYARLKWFDRVDELGEQLLGTLKEEYGRILEKKEEPLKALMEPARSLFEQCLSRGISVEELYEINDEAMETYEKRDFDRAKELFLELLKELEWLIAKDDKMRETKVRVQKLREEVKVLIEKAESYGFVNISEKRLIHSAYTLFQQGQFKTAEEKYTILKISIQEVIKKNQLSEELRQLINNPFHVKISDDVFQVIRNDYSQGKKWVDKYKNTIDEKRKSIEKKIWIQTIGRLTVFIIGTIINAYSWYILLFKYDDWRSFYMYYFWGFIIVSIFLTLSTFGLSFRSRQLRRHYALKRPSTHPLLVVSIVLLILNIIVGFLLYILY